MATAYRPQKGVHVGRPPCRECGADFHLHRPASGTMADGRGLGRLYEQGVALLCPTRYRPASLGEAVVAHADAELRNDPAAVFTARGEIQRLLGRDHQRDGCPGCLVLHGGPS